MMTFIENNLNPGSILVRDGHYQYNVMFNNELKSIDDIANIFIKKDNRIFRLRELTDIGIRTQERTGMFLNKTKE